MFSKLKKHHTQNITDAFTYSGQEDTGKVAFRSTERAGKVFRNWWYWLAIGKSVYGADNKVMGQEARSLI